MSRSRSRWQSVHLHDHLDHDALITRLLGPLLEGLSPHITGSFFIRYWEGGPHVRLRVRLSESADGPWVRHTMLGHAERYFRARPAAAHLDAEEWAARERVYGELEGLEDRGAVRGLVGDGRAVFAPYHPETAKYGGRRGVAVAEEVFLRSSDVVRETLPRVSGSEPARLHAGLAMMRAALDAAGLTESETERFFAAYREFWSGYAPPRLRRKWPDRATGESSPPHVPAVGEKAWLAAVAEAVSRARDDGVGFLAGITVDRGVFEDPVWFLLCHYLHTHNNRLGIPPWEEAYLAYLADGRQKGRP